MKSPYLVVALIMLSVSSLRAAEDVHVQTSWEINPGHQTYKNIETKVSLGPRIAVFRLHEALPGRSDGSAKFIYYGDKGFITLYHEPRALVGAASPAAYVDAQSGAMEKGNGKFDSKLFFAAHYQAGGKTASGRCVVYHFIHSPEIDGKEVWDEFGVVQIGAFFFSYRGSFLAKSGLDDLATFLRAIGIRKA
jgi:hypothetical protein